MKLRFLLGLCAALALVTVACGGNDTTPAAAQTDDLPPAVARLPNQIVGLQVVHEDVSDRVEGLERPYIDSIALVSLREDDLLRAMLQMSRLNRYARPESAAFRSQVVSQLGAVDPIELNVGGTRVYATGGAEQDMYVWFEGRGMYVLSVHQDFPFPRTLLRRTMERVEI